ncbi:unnamed protein product [Pleuronectes platessa]|uniref:CASAMP N-terminal domain-containing protein n=1 Tax=Pleuronectes platessa TaxID=8262 RepID=A0A9N7TIY0_PLEPL|nr:unnamed protein product [Pleuronectes platessa]
MEDSPGAMKRTCPVPEIKPLDQYDISRAKICASVRWLLSKSYGSAGTHTPEPARITAAAAAAWAGRFMIHPRSSELEVSRFYLGMRPPASSRSPPILIPGARAPPARSMQRHCSRTMRTILR